MVAGGGLRSSMTGAAKQREIQTMEPVNPRPGDASAPPPPSPNLDPLPLPTLEAPITIREMMEAGVHFGHQTRRWNPKMKTFIFGARNGIHIIDLQQTVRAFNKAYRFLVSTVSNGRSVLFVGTKKQAQEVMRDEALRGGQ